MAGWMGEISVADGVTTGGSPATGAAGVVGTSAGVTSTGGGVDGGGDGGND